MKYVVAYDIADDHRREDVATLLSGYGPRVQLSVFECEFRTRREAGSVQGKLRDLIDPVDDPPDKVSVPPPAISRSAPAPDAVSTSPVASP